MTDDNIDLKAIPAYLRDADAKDVGYLLLAGMISLVSLAVGPLVVVASVALSMRGVNLLRTVCGLERINK